MSIDLNKNYNKYSLGNLLLGDLVTIAYFIHILGIL